jgi:2-iminobutanoate/2-iminopropanoate deaminase
MKTVIATKDAPAAVGPYSQAIATGDLLFCAGQIPLVPATGELAGDDITTQARQVCENIKAVLAANGMTFANVVKSTVFLPDLADFAAMNEVYKQYFTEPYPARSTIGISALPRALQGGDRSHRRTLMQADELLALFRQTGALLDGHFLLRSGLHSRQFFQCALLLQHTPIAAQVCGALADKLRGIDAPRVISPALGGVIVGHEVARAAGQAAHLCGEG